MFVIVVAVSFVGGSVVVTPSVGALWPMVVVVDGGGDVGGWWAQMPSVAWNGDLRHHHVQPASRPEFPGEKEYFGT